MQSESLRRTALTFLAGSLGLWLLLASWVGLYVFLLAWTEGALAPWATIKTYELPIGTLSRALNDFFDWRGPHVPSIIIVVGGLGATIFRFIRARKRILVLWQALLINVLFLLALFPTHWLGLALDNLAATVTNSVLLEPRFSFGYFVAACGLWLGYLVAQGFGLGFVTKFSVKR